MAAYNLAIETASRQGWVTLGRDDAMIETAPLPQHRRHNIELMPSIDALCQRHGIQRHELKEVYTSLGPGSFTGLRIAIATVKMLAMVLSVRVVGVPSLDVLAYNAPAEAQHVAVALNLKRGTMHCQRFERASDGLMAVNEPALRTVTTLLDDAPRPITLIGEKLPELEARHASDPKITTLTADAALPDPQIVWRLGRERAQAGRFDDPWTLTPLYIREPEAVTLWREQTT